MTSSRNFGTLKELLQLEAIGTSIGSNHYRVLLPALPGAPSTFDSAHIDYSSKPRAVLQLFFKNYCEGRSRAGLARQNHLGLSPDPGCSRLTA